MAMTMMRIHSIRVVPMMMANELNALVFDYHLAIILKIVDLEVYQNILLLRIILTLSLSFTIVDVSLLV